jgi:hypothetical protein
MARKKEAPTASIVQRFTLLTQARESLEAGQVPSEPARVELIASLDFLLSGGALALEQLEAAKRSLRESPLNQALKDLLLFDLHRFPLEPSQEVREQILADAKRAVRSKPLDVPKRAHSGHATVVGGNAYVTSEGNPYAGLDDDAPPE